jgi:hypothetical protein
VSTPTAAAAELELAAAEKSTWRVRAAVLTTVCKAVGADVAPAAVERNTRAPPWTAIEAGTSAAKSEDEGAKLKQPVQPCA